MFNSFLSLFGISSLARNTVLDDTDFTYRVKNFSISNNEETKIEETFVTSVINPVENYEGLSVESTIKKSEETFVKTVINPIKNNQETLPIESSIINTPTEVKKETLPIEPSIINSPTEVKEEIKHVHSGQDYEHYLKAIQLELQLEKTKNHPVCYYYQSYFLDNMFPISFNITHLFISWHWLLFMNFSFLLSHIMSIKPCRIRLN